METDYKKIATETRLKVLEMIHRAQTSHIGSNFSVIDLAVVVYENLREGDRVVWSKGWSAATTYALLARHGVIPEEDLLKFPNEPYIGLAEPSVKGVETAGGAMGHGLPVAAGMAWGFKKAHEEIEDMFGGDDHRPTMPHVYCILSDGEMNEGTTWESALFAAHHQLNNLTVLIDRNKWQAMGRTEDVMKIDQPELQEKWESFGWEDWRGDGHDHKWIDKTINTNSFLPKPKVVICDTIKGKGVSFMEDHLLFHYKYVDDVEYKKAKKELEKQL